MRRAIALVALLALSACVPHPVGPARTDGKYESKARTTLDQDVQKEQYKIWQEQLAADIPYIWLYETQAVVIASTKVHDVTKATLPDGQPQLSMVSVVHPLAQVWISE